MALYIPHNIFHLARLLYVTPETFGPYYVISVMMIVVKEDSSCGFCQNSFLRISTVVSAYRGVLESLEVTEPADCSDRQRWTVFKWQAIIDTVMNLRALSKAVIISWETEIRSTAKKYSAPCSCVAALNERTYDVRLQSELLLRVSFSVRI